MFNKTIILNNILKNKIINNSLFKNNISNKMIKIKNKLNLKMKKSSYRLVRKITKINKNLYKLIKMKLKMTIPFLMNFKAKQMFLIKPERKF